MCRYIAFSPPLFESSRWVGSGGVASAICRAPSPFFSVPRLRSRFFSSSSHDRFSLPPSQSLLLQSRGRGRCLRRRASRLASSRAQRPPPSSKTLATRPPRDLDRARCRSPLPPSCPGLLIPALFLLLFEVVQPEESPALFAGLLEFIWPEFHNWDFAHRK